MSWLLDALRAVGRVLGAVAADEPAPSAASPPAAPRFDEIDREVDAELKSSSKPPDR